MSRRKGQNPKLRIGTRNDGTQYFYIQYWLDVAGVEDRKRRREVFGPVKTKSGGLTKTQAEARKMQFLAELNGRSFAAPSSKVFADAVKHYREVFAPRMLRTSTFSVADGHLKTHLETDWNNVPVDHITIERVNEWAWKKRKQGLSWVTVKNILRTMQRVLSASSKDQKVPFSQDGLAIPEKDKLRMRMESRENVSYSWEHALQIVEQIKTMDTLGAARREQYSTLFLLAAASGLRIGELLALRKDDIGENTIRVDESVDRAGTIGPCKNVAAYRTVVLADSEGRTAMKALRHFAKHDGLVFHSKNNGTLAETTILTQGVHPAVKGLGLPKAGMHAFRRGCNRRWELARISSAVIRQQMGHATADMTALYTGEIPVEQVTKHFQLEPNGAAVTAPSGN
jgi:integrase